MLRLSSVSRSYDADPILRDVSFFLSSGERMGLVGPNGSGKSTLLRLVAGLDRPDSGSVWIDPADSVAYLPQYPADELERSARDSLLSGMSGLGDLQRRVAELEDRMAGASDGELQALLGEYAAVQGEFERLGGYEIDARLERVTRGLGLEPEALSMPVRALSGGNKTKLSLARLLLSGASVLLLDEPTNYLDLPALLWLERFVLESGASYLIVSHDRRFLDRTVHGILELDLEAHTLRRWAGNYTEYAEAREREEAKQLEEYQDQQEEKRRIEADIRRTKDQALGVEQSTKLDTTRRYAKKVAAKAKARERRLEKSLERHEVEKPRRSWGLDLGDLERRAEGERIDDDRTVLTVRDVRASYGEREVLRGASLEVRGRDRVALLGPNGSGKSTLLGCVLGRTPYKGEIRIGSNVRVGQMSQETRELPLYSPVLEVLRARTPMYEDEARTYLHKFLFSGEQVRQPVGTLSYGQRQKLALALLVLSDANFLVLDEPTSYLDMPALEAVEAALAGYVGPLLVVSHDRAFLQALGVNRVGVLERGVLRPVQSVEEYEEEVMADGGVRS